MRVAEPPRPCRGSKATMVVFEHSGHSAITDEPEHFRKELRRALQ